MLLYHCFPRTRECNCQSCAEFWASEDACVRQIGIMMKHGLVLTPEHLRIPVNPRAEPGKSPRTVFSQTRACFTLAARELLWTDKKFLVDGLWKSHCEIFGKFAVGLTPDAGRRIGAVPVMYFYPGLGNDADRVNMTHEALFLLRELRSLTIALAWLEAMAPSTQGDESVWKSDTLEEVGHVLEGEQLAKKRIADASPCDAETVAYFLETKRPAACNLVERMDILLGFFQSADAPESRNGRQHEYYEQREWRIGHAFGPHVNASWLTDDRRGDDEAVMLGKYLQTTNPCFFDDERLKSSAILRGLVQPDEKNRRFFFDFVTEFICPDTAEAAVAALIEPVGFHKKRELYTSRRGAASRHESEEVAVVFVREEN